VGLPTFVFKDMKTPKLAVRTEFAAALNQICTERGISTDSVLETIKMAILAAYRKDMGIDEEFEYEVEVDKETGAAKVFKFKPDKKTQRQEVTPPGFGRIAAQTAKQVILQKIREAEKEAILDEYKDKLNQVVNGMVLRFDGTDIFCDIGRGQGVMPPQEQVRNENYHLNKRLSLYISDIRETRKGKQIIVSRANPVLVSGLFRREVPEVASGAVEIKLVAREPGLRSKVAVASKQAGVDPVGSCVGQKGVRVQAVIDELGGEKLDIIQYSADSAKFIAAALSPADNLKVIVNEAKKQATVTAPSDQLSLAIGKEGQNVRLAAKLTGYKIDIIGPEGKKMTAEEKKLKDEKKVKAKKKTVKKAEKKVKGSSKTTKKAVKTKEKKVVTLNPLKDKSTQK